jgi:DNA adenine methylase
LSFRRTREQRADDGTTADATEDSREEPLESPSTGAATVIATTDRARPAGSVGPTLIQSQPIKWHGGKKYLAKRIIDLMPPHRHYVEPYAGGLAVLMAKNPEGVSEVVNDLNGGLTNFWRVLRDPDCFERFRRQIEATPCSEAEWRRASALLDSPPDDPVAWAWAFFVTCRQSMAGRMEGFTPLGKTRTRRGMNELPSAWLTAVEGLPAVHARLKRVVILNRPALGVIRTQDGPGTLFYCDPPYLHQTRSDPEVYAHEMTEADHRELLEVLLEGQGKVMLSGYPSELYDGTLKGWNRHTFDIPNHAAGGGAKRAMTECLWCNF